MLLFLLWENTKNKVKYCFVVGVLHFWNQAYFVTQFPAEVFLHFYFCFFLRLQLYWHRCGSKLNELSRVYFLTIHLDQKCVNYTQNIYFPAPNSSSDYITESLLLQSRYYFHLPAVFMQNHKCISAFLLFCLNSYSDNCTLMIFLLIAA